MTEHGNPREIKKVRSDKFGPGQREKKKVSLAAAGDPSLQKVNNLSRGMATSHLLQKVKVQRCPTIPCITIKLSSASF